MSHYCPTLLFWVSSRFIFLDRLIKSSLEFRSPLSTGAAIAIRLHVLICAPLALSLVAAWNCISATRNALRSRKGSLICPETLLHNGITIPPPVLSKERSRFNCVLVMTHSRHDLLQISRTAVCSRTRKTSRKSENPSFPWGVFHLKSKLPFFSTLFSLQQIFSPPLQVWHRNTQHYILKYVGSLNNEKKDGILIMRIGEMGNQKHVMR